MSTLLAAAHLDARGITGDAAAPLSIECTSRPLWGLLSNKLLRRLLLLKNWCLRLRLLNLLDIRSFER
jgi:hypothetical protein